MKVVTSAGEVIELGTVETAPTIGITDYSRRETDDFGVTTVVKRGFSRLMSVRLAVPFDGTGALQRRLASLRATPATWTADDRFTSLSIRGFYKDFEVDHAVPPLSYCKLTVEGLAETAPIADAGSDPAVSGKSTLQLLQPVVITADRLIASSVPEADAAEWSAQTTYALGARVMKAATHRVYEAAAGANTGNDPAGASGKWIDVGPTNRWAMFDQALGSLTSATNAIAVTLDAPAIQAVALLDVTAATVRLQAVGYDRTVSASAGSITFLDLPAGTTRVTVTIAGTAVSVGTLLIGKLVGLGVTEASPTSGITDYSRKDVDQFGAVTIVQRAWAKRMAAKSLIDTAAIDVVANRIASVRATPALWIGLDGLDSLTVYGFFKDFSIEVGETTSKLSLSIEGLSAATNIVPLDETVNWEDVGNPTGTKPTNNADKTADNFSKDTNAVGGRASNQVIAAVDKAKSDIDGLVATFGTTASAAASANAARDAETNAKTARDAAQVARDAAQDARALAGGSATTAVAAKTDAQTASTASAAARDASQAARDLATQKASDAAASATGAGGSATTASGQATIATQKADAAGQSASTASAKADVATTQAGNATVSAGKAATSESNALGSSQSAATQAGVAVSSAGQTLPQFLDTGLTHFGTLLVGATQATKQVANVGTVLEFAGTNYARLWNLNGIALSPGARIRFTLGARVLSTSTGTGSAAFQYSIGMSDLPRVPGTTVPPNVTTGTTTAIAQPSYPADDVWRETIIDYIVPATPPAGFLYFAPLLYVANTAPSRVIQVRYIKIEDVTSMVGAAASATAAAGSASTASTSQTAAGASASAAKLSETSAGTSAGTATTKASEASTSAIGALGSANSASASQIVAATSAAASKTAAAALLPRDFAADGLFFALGHAGAPAARVPLNTSAAANTIRVSYADDATYGRVLSTSNPDSIGNVVFSQAGAIKVVTGRKYRITLIGRSVPGSPSPILRSSVAYLSATYGLVQEITKDATAPETWQTVVTDVDGTAAIAAGAVYLRAGATIGNGRSNQFALVQIEDVTDSVASQAAATASAGSASTASTKADAAGQSATSATAALNAAKTAQGSAEAARDQAAQSKTDAAGSASSASGSATLSAGSATTAGQKATAAATSEQNAASSATTAGQQASASEASKTAAVTARGQAETFANQASTSKDNAAGSASTASTQAGLAAQSKTDAQSANAAAAASATAANTSAGTASTKADAAGASAQAANQAKLDAQAAQGSATSSASAANGSAVAASGSASSAQTSAMISSSYSSAAININDKFANWPDPTAYPVGWSVWSSGGSYRIQQAAGLGSAYGLYTLNDAPNVDSGFQQGITLHNGLWVVEATVTKTGGTWSGSGISISGAKSWHFGSEADTAGLIASNTADGSTRTWSKMFRFNGEFGAVATLYGMVGWSQFGGADPKYLIWKMLRIRPANAGDLGADKALTDSATNTARIEQVNSTLTTIYGSLSQRTTNVEARAGTIEARTGIVETAVASTTSKLAAARVEISAVSPGGRASVTVRSDTTNGAAIDFGADLNIVGNIKVQRTVGGKTIMIDSDTGITFNNGTIMKVMGVGFGSANQFVEWMGPSLSTLAQCTEANGYSYTKTDGSGYYGGGLSAGTLKNSVASSDLAAAVTTTVGPFGSNGKAVRYIASWSYSSATSATYPATAAGLQQYNNAVASNNATSDGAGGHFGVTNTTQPNSTVTLSRTFAGQAAQQLDQRAYSTQQSSFAGRAPIVGDSPGQATITTTIGGGATIADPTLSATNRTLTLTLGRGFTSGSANLSQRLSIVSVEE